MPMGDVVGISIAARGAIVTELASDGGKACPAKDAGILPGDVIVKIAGESVASCADAGKALSGHAGEEISVTVLRGGVQKQLFAVPADDGNGRAVLGVMLRDTMSGIGTVTYYDPETGAFGALGHPVSDADTGTALPLRRGIVTDAEVTGIIAGKCGEPGQLCGEIDLGGQKGKIEKNTDVGIYGTASFDVSGRGKIPIAAKSEITTGEVTILSAALGDVEEYSAEITRIYSGGEREMMIKITDERLLEAAGGIVQGMSGSPIIQNGRLIGAVTHVLVNDPARGYAVSAERMLAEGAFAERAA